MITHARLLELLTYNPDTGAFTWRVKLPRSKKEVGELAGHIIGTGYRQIRIEGEAYQGHRLAWFYMTGKWPADLLDHINGVRSDNKFENLREATFQQNNWNSRPQEGRHSQWKGVTFDPGRKRCWKMSFRMPTGESIQKRFVDEREAAEEYIFLALEHHGEFARFD